MESIFLEYQSTYLTQDRLKKIIEIQNSIEINDLNYYSNKNNYIFSNYSLPVVFFRDTYGKKLSINDADEEQSIFYNEIKREKHGRIRDEKKFFWENLEFLFYGREKVLNAFRGKIFPMKVVGDNACKKIDSKIRNQNIYS